MMPPIAPVAVAASLAVTTVDGYRGRDRLLIVFAPTAVNAALAMQRQNSDVAAFVERDVREIDVIGGAVRGATDAAATLRRRFGVGPSTFRVVLLGKDGSVALDAITPLPAARIEAAIDAMPMRQQEVRQRQTR